ncbi:MAG: hypothetical protein J6U04_02685 [Salinivirgaceae bacterium]|nr:hypothetical protein [Salinivirgaceae bacterium]
MEYLIYIATITLSAFIMYKMRALHKNVRAKIRRIAQNPVKLRGRFVTWSAKSVMAPICSGVKYTGADSKSATLAFEYENGEIIRDYRKTFSILPQNMRESDTEILSFNGNFVSADGTEITVYTALDMEAYSSSAILSTIIANRELNKNEINAEVWLNADNPKEYIVVSFLNYKARWILKLGSRERI